MVVVYSGIEDMPPPDKKVRYPGGMFGPAMFHYAPEGADFRAIAREHGFEVFTISMEQDLRDDDHPLMKAYFERGELEPVLKAWRPKRPEGAKWVGLHDTEDGPVAVFLRKIEPTESTTRI